MNRFFLYSIIMAVTITIGCDPLVIDVELPDAPARMTINTNIIADSSWSIGLTRGQHVLDPQYEFEDIGNATVTVFEDDHLLTTLTYDPPDLNRGEEHGAYISDRTSDIFPKPGKTYEVRVHSDEYADVSAFCSIPLPVAVADIEVYSWDLDDNSMISMIVHINDPAQQENFYELFTKMTIAFTHPVTGNLTQKYEIETPVYTADPLFYQKSETFDFLDPNIKPLPVLFNDAGLEGKLLKINCRAQVYPSSLGPNQKMHYEVVVRTLSKEYYQYMVTRKLQEAARRDPFAQPVKIYSNVENGFGIFAGYSQSAMLLE